MNCARSNRTTSIARLFQVATPAVMVFVIVIVAIAQIDEVSAGGCEFECSARALAEPETCGDNANDGCYAPMLCLGPSGDCCHPHDWPGCDDAVCEAAVCSADPFCCDVMWDNLCSGAACGGGGIGCDCAVAAGGFPNPFTSIQPGEVFCGTSWSEGLEHDTDWYCFEAPANGTVIECNVQSEFAVTVTLRKKTCFFGAPIATATGECSTTMTALIPDAGQHCLIVAPAGGEAVSCGKLNSYDVSLTILKACHADIQPTGAVDVDDLLLVINSWGACVKCAADLMPLAGGNGVVDVDDLLAVLNAWGPCE